MKKSSTAFLTTVFPSCENYLDEFLESLASQTDLDFDLIIINDGFKNLTNFTKRFTTLNTIEVISNNSPIQNRIIGLNYVLENNYQQLIFGDSDDYFAENRVAISKEYLSKNDIVVNDLTLFSQQEKTPKIFKNITFSKEDLVKKNMFGLSNTAIRTAILKDVNLNPQTKIIAYDWYMFSLLVFKGFTFKFTAKTISFYRQYHLNTLGISHELDKKNLQNLLLAKKLHLKELKKHYSEIDKSEYSLIFENELKIHLELEAFLEQDKQKIAYLLLVNKHIESLFSGWFSQLISLKKYNTLNESTN